MGESRCFTTITVAVLLKIDLKEAAWKQDDLFEDFCNNPGERRKWLRSGVGTEGDKKCHVLGYILKVESSSSADGLVVGGAVNQEISDESKVFGLSQKFNRLC